MISPRLTKQQLSILIFGFIAIFGLLASVFLVQQRQDTRNRASYLTNDIRVTLSSSGNLSPGGAGIPVAVKMQNASTTDKTINVGSIKFQYDASKLTVTIPESPCGTDLPNNQIKTVGPNITTGTNTVEIVCSTSGGANYTFAKDAVKTIATFNIAAKSGTTGQTDITFLKTQVVEVPSYANLADGGTVGTFSIESQSTPIVKVSFSSSQTTLAPGGSVMPVNIVMQNNFTTDKTINVGSIKFQYDASKLTVTIPESPCGTDLPNNQIKTVGPNITTGTNTVEIVCSTSGGANYTFAKDAVKTIATFNIAAKSGTTGQTDITFLKTQVVEVPSNANLADGGTKGSFNISAVNQLNLVKVYLQSSTYNLTPGGDFVAVDVIMRNVDTSARKINVGSIIVGLDPSKLEATMGAILTEPPCGSALPNLQRKVIFTPGGTGPSLVEIVCSSPGGSDYTLPAVGNNGGTEVKLATFKIRAKPGTAGQAGIYIKDAKIVEVPSYNNLAYPFLETVNYTIAGDNPYRIAIGKKDPLVINIGGGSGDTPFIKFAVRFFGLEGINGVYPDIKVRLNVAEPIVKLTPAPNGGNYGDGCVNAGYGDHFYKDIVLQADSNKVYTPKPGTSFIHAGQSYTVDSDGWIPLAGRTQDTVYSLSVKGPKHRNVLMENSISLLKSKADSQNYDWTGDDKIIEPGDLSDPNIGNNQNCVVNMIDISLINTRIGCTQDTSNTLLWNCPAGRDVSVSPEIADVDYNGIINAADISQVVHTLNTKPDDD